MRPVSDSDQGDVTRADSVERELATWESPDRSPVPDPGIEPHVPRLTDIDDKAAQRATRQVAAMFGLVPILAVGFVVIYFAVPRDAAFNFGFLHTNTNTLVWA